jgi:hypothetical protein
MLKVLIDRLRGSLSERLFLHARNSCALPAKGTITLC